MLLLRAGAFRSASRAPRDPRDPFQFIPYGDTVAEGVQAERIGI